MRLPGSQVTAALRSAFGRAPEEFKFALAESLRQRGEKVAGYPSQKARAHETHDRRAVEAR